MKKSDHRKSILLPLLLLLATGSAWAGWEKIGETDQKTIYVDRATLRKEGDLRRIWSIQDFKQRSKDGEMSSRMRSEYDCKGERYRFLGISTHSESMAGGKMLFSALEDLKEPWSEIPPESAGERILKIACAQ